MAAKRSTESDRPDMVSIREGGRGYVFLQNGDCRKIAQQGGNGVLVLRLCLRPELRTPGKYYSRFGKIPEIACNGRLVAVLFEDFAFELQQAHS